MPYWYATAFAVFFVLAGLETRAAEQVPVEAFATSNKFDSPRISPDGLHIAIASDTGDGNHAILVYRIVDMAQTALLRLPRYELPVQIHWVSAKRLIIAKGKQIGSREKPIPMGEIIATDYDGKNQKYIYGYEQSTRTAGIERGFGYIEGLPSVPNGHFYMRRLSIGTSRSMLYDVNAEKATHRLIADIGVKDLSFVLDPLGVPRFAYGTDDADNYLLYEADTTGKNWKPVPSSRTGGKFIPISFTPDASQIFAYYSVDDGPTSLVKSDLSTAKQQVLLKDDFGSVNASEWTASWQPFAATHSNGKPRTIYFDKNSKDAKLHEVLNNSFPGEYATYINHSADGNVSLVYVYSDRNPGAWYLLDHKQGSVSKILANREGIDPAKMGERRYFRFKASDGLELDGYLTLPAGLQQPSHLPMVLLPHGGPHAPGDSWAFDTDAQFLASRGYLVLQVNYRGSQGRGYRFQEAGHRKWGTRIQDDLIDGIRWTIAQGYADPNRICAYGASFGGYSAMMVAAKAPELIKCTVGLSGLYDLKTMVNKSDSANTAYGRNFFTRTVGTDPKELEANSPTFLAARLRAPVFLAHGEIDERTPYSQALAMRNALEKAGNSPEWMSVPKEGHGFYKDHNNIAFYTRLEAFLARHIGPGTR